MGTSATTADFDGIAAYSHIAVNFDIAVNLMSAMRQ